MTSGDAGFFPGIYQEISDSIHGKGPMFAKISALEKAPAPTVSNNEYATDQTFCQIFVEDMNQLYLLALLLTGDYQRAEQCLIASLEDCVFGLPVFGKWARGWTRRKIITNAIRIVSPATTSEGTVCKADSPEPAMRLDLREPLEAITRLGPFERFAFVLSVFERYTVRECSILLKGARADVIRARIRALQKLAGVDSGDTHNKPNAQSLG
jgi:hypothetical protein